MRGLLPDMVVDRTTKAAFDAPEANLAFVRFCQEAVVSTLSDLVDAEQFIRYFSFRSASHVDVDLTWPIYGLHAAACFLGHAGTESAELS
jgi:hypothetical protein